MVSLDTLGKSYEGNEQYEVTIGADEDGNKPIIWVDGGTHAREWVTTASVLYYINKVGTG